MLDSDVDWTPASLTEAPMPLPVTCAPSELRIAVSRVTATAVFAVSPSLPIYYALEDLTPF